MGTEIPSVMNTLKIDKLPIEIREHILSYIDDISLIPDGLSEGFWKKWFGRNGVDRVMFASWKKSAAIIKDYNRLNEKRKILALLDWEQMYVGTLADITIGKNFAEYKMKREVIAAAGRTGLCMLVEPANMEDESYLDISPRGSIMQDNYTGEFTSSSDTPLKNKMKNDRILFGKGVVAWYHHDYSMNNTLYRVVRNLLTMYNVQYNWRGFGTAHEGEYLFEDEYIFEDENDECELGLRHDQYICAYGQQLPMLCQSLVYTKDPFVFEKPHVIEMFYKKNEICTVKDSEGNLNAFIVCVPTWEELHSLLCTREQLCYFITEGGNIYFEKSYKIYDKYV